MGLPRAKRFGARHDVRLVGGGKIDRAGLAVAAGFDFVIQALLLIERLHAGSLHRGDVNEAVFRTIVGLDEAIALVGVEKLYGSGLAHIGSFQER